MVWAAILIFAAATACVLPAPGDELAPLDNRPPRIEPPTLSPGPGTIGVVRVLPDDCRAEFSLSVSDPDVDTLFYQVFVDQPLQPPSAELPAPVSILLDPTDRRQRIVFSVEGRYVGTNPHTVEVLVADREFSTERSDSGLLGRSLIDPEGLTASFMWPVVLEDACEDLAQ